ncbi:MAG TPA: hypothetical protein VGR90_06400, partial [Acidimicrobiales bacterium]|nr:hypothetical protein [Acidimicrobiales bacterium]
MKTIHRLAAGAVVAIAATAPATTALAAAAPQGPTGNPSAGSTSAPSGSSSAAGRWQEVHAKVLEALNDRVKTLADLTTSVQSNKYLTSDHQQALMALLAPATQGIGALDTQVQNATPQNTTVQQLEQDARTMVDQYRVYLVRAPQVHFTEAADTQTAVELEISTDEPKIQAAIQKAGNPPNAVQAYNDLLTQVQNATTATGQANIPAVLQVTPSGYPGDDAPLTNARTALGQADQDLKAARTDIEIIRNAVKQGDASTQGGSTG